MFFLCQVFYTESLTSPSEDEETLCQSVPVIGCRAAVFIPTQPARLAVLHHNDLERKNDITIFDIIMKKTKYKSEIIGEDSDMCTLTSKSQYLEDKKENSLQPLLVLENMQFDVFVVLSFAYFLG